MELFLPHQRVLYYSILECFLPVGGMLIAFVASQVKNWRLLLQICNIPGLLFLSYFWLLPLILYLTIFFPLPNDIVIDVLVCLQADGRIYEVAGIARQTRQSDQRAQENSDRQQKTTARHIYERENGGDIL